MGNKDILDEELTEAKEGEFKIDWKRKLTSRKLWMAIALFVSGIFAATGHKETGVIVAGLIMQGAAVIAYIIGEGLVDAANTYNNIGTEEITYEEEE